jgi:hypothetical protein
VDLASGFVCGGVGSAQKQHSLAHGRIGDDFYPLLLYSFIQLMFVFSFFFTCTAGFFS